MDRSKEIQTTEQKQCCATNCPYLVGVKGPFYYTGCNRDGFIEPLSPNEYAQYAPVEVAKATASILREMKVEKEAGRIYEHSDEDELALRLAKLEENWKETAETLMKLGRTESCMGTQDKPKVDTRIYHWIAGDPTYQPTLSFKLYELEHIMDISSAGIHLNVFKHEGEYPFVVRGILSQDRNVVEKSCRNIKAVFESFSLSPWGPHHVDIRMVAKYKDTPLRKEIEDYMGIAFSE